MPRTELSIPSLYSLVSGGLLLVEIAEGVTVEEVLAKTGAPLKVASSLKRFG